MTSRRAFLFNCSTVVAGLALMPSTQAELWDKAVCNYPSAGKMGYAALAAQINTNFSVQHPSGQVVTLRLLKAPLARHASDAGQKQFSLIFSGPKEVGLEPAIYRFEHDQLGRFEMYIGGIGLPDKTGARYEAVFNQHVPVAAATARPA